MTLAAANGVHVFAVFQNGIILAVTRVLRGLAQGELGRVRVAAVRVRWCRPQRYYDLAAWRGTFAMDGGCLTNQGIHHIDLLRQIGGEVARVSAAHATLGAEIEVEDTATASIEFREWCDRRAGNHNRGATDRFRGESLVGLRKRIGADRRNRRK